MKTYNPKSKRARHRRNKEAEIIVDKLKSKPLRRINAIWSISKADWEIEEEKFGNLIAEEIQKEIDEQILREIIKNGPK